jgi:hypothetical protein
MGWRSFFGFFPVPAADRRRGKWPAAIFMSVALALIARHPALAENSEITIRRAAERTSFTNDEIMNGFFKIAFRAELALDRPAEQIRKFDEPVRVFVASNREPARRAIIAAVVDDIRARVDHLDIAITDDRNAANFVVMLVPKRDFKRAVRSLYGPDQARKIQQRLNPQCLSGIGKDESYRIRRAEVLLPVDADEFTFYDCAYEEILQGLGVINDDSSVPWTMFNDDVQMGFFDVYDQYLLNILYDPRVRPGMTKEDVGRLEPEVLPAVRAWVAEINSRAGATARSEVLPKTSVPSAPGRIFAPGGG